MAVFARQRIAFGTSYTAQTRYEFGPDAPIDKLVIAIVGDSVRLQLSDRYPPIFENAFDTEIELDEGTHSLSFPFPVYGFRIRAANDAAICTFRALEGDGSDAPDTYTKDVAFSTAGLASEATLEAIRNEQINAGDSVQVPGVAQEATLGVVDSKQLTDINVEGFHWPCQSGEDDPPVYDAGGGVATGGYSTAKGSIPSYKIDLGNGNRQTAQWKGVPRVGVDTDKTVLRIEFMMLLNTFTTAADYNYFTYGAYGANSELTTDLDRQVLVRGRSSDGFGRVISKDGTATQETSLGAGAFTPDLWHYVRIELDETENRYYLNNVLRATHDVRYWPPFAPALEQAPQIVVRPTSQGLHISQLRFTYLRPEWV